MPYDFARYSRAGFLQALCESGLEATRLIAFGTPPITMREGARAMKQMLLQWPDTQAVMCQSDLSAFGAMTECQRNGLFVPGEMAIGGFGSYDLSEHAIPAITTIDVGARNIGRQAAARIVALLSSPNSIWEPVQIQPELIVRQSS